MIEEKKTIGLFKKIYFWYYNIRGISQTDLVESLDETLKSQDEDNQKIKADAGKKDYTLVPLSLLDAVEQIRQFGVSKYKERDSWKKVKKERYIKALYRHFVEFLKDNEGLDDDSNMPHIWHMACNIAFLIEMQGEDYKIE